MFFSQYPLTIVYWWVILLTNVIPFITVREEVSRADLRRKAVFKGPTEEPGGEKIYTLVVVLRRLAEPLP